MVFCCIAIVGIAIIYFIMLWIRQLFTWPRLDKNHHHPTRYKPPPRALTGNRAWPVYGHTYLFMNLAGNTALEFPAHWRQVSFLPFTRHLGECFAIFIWGQWRVAIKGPRNAAAVLNGQRLKTDWPWTPPVRLLGQACLPILEEKDAEQADALQRLIQGPLSHRSVLSFAPQFAECASQCLHQIQLHGEEARRKQQQRSGVGSERSVGNNNNNNNNTPSRAVPSGISDNGDMDSMPSGIYYPLDYKVKWQALRSYTLDIMVGPLWNMSLRDQPAREKFGENNNNNNTQTQAGQSTKEGDTSEKEETNSKTVAKTKPVKKKDLPPKREHMLLWMERMKLGIDVIKTTFGPEWMYIWILNEYGRAINARMYVERHVSRHVKKMESMVPVSHKRGHGSFEPSTRIIPLLALKDNFARSNEDIFGEQRIRTWSRTDSFQTQTRPRSYSQPSVLPGAMQQQREGSDGASRDGSSSVFGSSSLGDLDVALCSDYVTPFETEQDLARPRYEQSPYKSPEGVKKAGAADAASGLRHLQLPMESSVSPSLRKGRKELTANNADALRAAAGPPGVVDGGGGKDENEHQQQQQQQHSADSFQTPSRPKMRTPAPPVSPNDNNMPQAIKEPVTSLLENLLLQEGDNGKGISQAVLTEISILLWMIMDVGNAWTAMALHLLSTDRDACYMVQEEIDNLEERHGHNLYSPSVLKKMKHLDALIFESIRLTPAFLGGLKSTTETVDLEDAGVHIAKGSHVFFCQATDQKFDLQRALGQRPENLGKRYPSVELYGFLPLNGLEVPLMVLQCKVFLIAALRDFSPLVCRRRRFIQRVKSAVEDNLRRSFHGLTPSKSREGGAADSHSHAGSSSLVIDGMEEMSDTHPVGQDQHLKSQGSLASSTLDPEGGLPAGGEVSQIDAMGFFTKIPFPEPKRVIRLRPRVIE